MDHVDFLDRVLNHLNRQDIIRITKEKLSEFTDSENDFLPQALRKLEKDGYAEQLESRSYKISFEGKLALTNTSTKFKNKPYKYKLHKEISAARYNKLKTAAIVANAIIALALSLAAVLVQYSC